MALSCFKDRVALVLTLFLFLLLAQSFTASEATLREEERTGVARKLHSLQIPFLENKGQIQAEKVRYYARTFGGAVFITEDGKIVYALPKYDDAERAHGRAPLQEQKLEKGGWAIEESFVGASISAVIGEDTAASKVSYFKGNDPAKWKTSLPTYNQVNLGEIYSGIELKLKAYGNNMEKLFYVKANADPKAIKVRVEGAQGLSVNESGELELETTSGAIKFTKPLAYQESGGEKKYVEVAYGVRGNEYGFALGEYDRTKELVIDPLLASTFLGGSGDDFGVITLAPDGSVYVGGATASSDFPTTVGAYDTTYQGGGPNGQDAFVARFNANLTSLMAVTFIGGALGNDSAGAPVIDSSGNVYIAGTTNSSDFPVTIGAFDTTFNGGTTATSTDVFVAKLDGALSNLLAATYLGGTINNAGTGGNENAGGIALNSAGEVYVVAQTDSMDFPTTPGAYDTTYNDFDTTDNIIAKLSSDLSTLMASSYLGGGLWEVPYSMTMDSAGNVYIVGRTSSYNYPTTVGAYDTNDNAYPFPYYDGFISKLDANLATLIASTYLGSTGQDIVWYIGIGSGGEVYVAGDTTSPGFPTTVGAYDTTHNGSNDGFVTKFNSNLTSLMASTFVGGSLFDRPLGAVPDGSGSLYVSGYTSSTDYPTTAGAYSETFNGGTYDGFIPKMSDDLTTLQASTYLGGSDVDVTNRVQIGPHGNIYFGGYTRSANFPVSSSAYDTVQNGLADVYVAKLDRYLSPGNCLVGDADGNGSVNVIDAVKTLRISLSLDSPPQELCPIDIDGSSTVDIIDVVNILRIALGLPAT